MKRTILFCVMSLAATTFAQRVHFEDTTHGFIIDAKDFSILNPQGPVYHFTLSAPDKVHAVSKSQGIEFFAPKLAVDAVSVKKKGGKANEANAIRNASATGGVRAISTGKSGRSEITGPAAKYTAKGESGGTLVVTGPVKLSNFSAQRQSFVATGSSLNAELGAGATNNLRSATLNGPVHLTIHKPGVGGQAGTDANVTAQRMVYEQTGGSATIKLSGGVKSTGLYGGANVIGGTSEVVLSLNEKGEITKISGSDRS